MRGLESRGLESRGWYNPRTGQLEDNRPGAWTHKGRKERTGRPEDRKVRLVLVLEAYRPLQKSRMTDRASSGVGDWMMTDEENRDRIAFVQITCPVLKRQDFGACNYESIMEFS